MLKLGPALRCSGEAAVCDAGIHHEHAGYSCGCSSSGSASCWCAWEGGRRQLKCLGPFHPCVRPGWSFWLQADAAPAGAAIWTVNPVDGIHPSLSLPLPPFLSPSPSLPPLLFLSLFLLTHIRCHPVIVNNGSLIAIGSFFSYGGHFLTPGRCFLGHGLHSF